MKKLISVLLAICVALSLCSVTVFASDTTQTTIEYEDDGSYTVITTQTHMSLFSIMSTTKSKTQSRSANHYDEDHHLLWTASITATFTYNGTTASCTSVSKSHTIYDSSWKLKSSNCSKSGATATGSFTFKKYVTLIPVKTINQTLTLTCDKNGNIT